MVHFILIILEVLNEFTPNAARTFHFFKIIYCPIVLFTIFKDSVCEVPEFLAKTHGITVDLFLPI